jgi:F-type H+-transporting ATPase subunit a
MESTQTEPKMEPAETKPKRSFFQKIGDYMRNKPRMAAIYIGLTLLLFVGFFIQVDQPHVSLAGEALFSNGPQWFTNSTFTTILVDIFLLVVAFLATRSMKVVPDGLQNIMEFAIEGLMGLSESVAGKDAKRYFPWVATIFLFVIISNWTDVLPGVGSIGFYHPSEGAHVEQPAEEAPQGGEEHSSYLDGQLAMAGGDLILVEAQPAPAASEEGEHKFVPLIRPPSADLNMTFALAITTIVLVQIFGVKALGGKYFKKFFNANGKGVMKGISAFVGLLELISEFSRIIAFGFRLFGNVFAGEIVLATMAFLITFLLPVPFFALEIFVGFVQALVFMMLALIFFSLSTVGHDHDEEHA